MPPTEQFYACTKDQPTGKRAKLLDRINEDPRGRTQLFTWMDLRTIAWVTWKVFDEMDDIKDILRVKITDIIPDFLVNWDITSTIGEAILECAQVLTQVLCSAVLHKQSS
ncbi:hypothetical protein EV363DRAFT_1521732 [Boletus edulis]|nr:hypothetical protein EV363DRAFT_1521732 [Boletus edulis]